VFALNVKTIFLMTRALKPYLEKAAVQDDPARIINIGSITGIVPQPVPTYSYDISKAAVHHLTRKLSTEFAPRITVNAIAPGFVPSRMSKGLSTLISEEDMTKAIPMGRWGGEADMGGVAVYLASRASM
jgi:NAD(P)-dependent dehydrogenase (short-subunit alcohol dehydrogenase family)